MSGNATVARQVLSSAVAVGFLVTGLGMAQLAAPEDAHASAFKNNSTTYVAKAPDGSTTRTPVGAVGYPGATGEAPGWCIEWTQWNYSTVKPLSKSTITSKNAAMMAYVYETRKASSSNWDEIAVASHELLDPTKSRTKKQAGDFGAPWGYYRTQGDYKKAVDKIQSWLKDAESRRGPYKMAPSVSLSSDKKSVSLSNTSVKTGSGANMNSFNGTALPVTATITGPATFSDGKKTKTFNAGANHTLKVTGPGKVSVSLAMSKKILPSDNVIKHSYARGKSQDKITVTPTKAAATGAAALTVPVIIPPPTFSVTTTAIDAADKDKRIDMYVGTNAHAAKIADTVSLKYTNVKKGEKFTVVSTLWDKTTKKATGITASSTITAGATSGTNSAVSTFSIPNARTYSGKQLVAYAEVKNSAGKVVASHKDINAASQTVTVATRVPAYTVTTSALDAADKDQRIELLKGTDKVAAKITDKVDFKYSNLVANQKYTVVSTLMDKGTKTSTGITASTPLTNTNIAGTNSITATFNIPDARKFTGKQLVAFAEIKNSAGKVVASHKDYNAASQTVAVATLPQTFKVTTNALDAEDKDQRVEIKSGLKVIPAKIEDTVNLTYTNVARDSKFTVTSTLMDKATKKSTGITATSTITNTALNGTNKSTSVFNIPDARKFAGKTLVAYAEIKDEDGKVVASHKDLNAATQTVVVGQVPTVTTKNIDKFDGDQYIQFGADAVVVTDGNKVTSTNTAIAGDTITGKDFISGETYTIKGWLMEAGGANTGIKSETTVKTTSTTLTAKVDFDVPGPKSVEVTTQEEIDNPVPQGWVDGTGAPVENPELDELGQPVDPTIVLDPAWEPKILHDVVDTTLTPSPYAGKTLVAFQEVYDSKGVLIAEHKDLKARSQSVDVLKPGIGTTATDKLDGDKIVDYTGGIVKDVIDYTGFPGGTKVVFTGQLMDKATGEPTGIVGETTITTPGDKKTVQKGSAVVEFEVPLGFQGKQLTAFEVAREVDGDIIAVHENINSASQTVRVGPGPELATQAKDALDGNQYLSANGGVIDDYVDYENLTPGKEYTVKGRALIAGTDTETEIVGETTFTPTEADGTVIVKFTIPAGHVGKSYSLRESLFNAEGGLVTSHNTDGKDLKQTFYVADVGTQAIDAADEDSYLPASGGEVIDKIKYTNLAPGVPVNVKGKMVIHVSGEETTISSEARFTPKTADGIYELKFAVPAEFAGKSLTAYEYLYDTEGNLIAKHEDPNDKEQTVHVAKLGTKASDVHDGDKFLSDAGGQIVDKIEYSNFEPGVEVEVKGKMVIHMSGEETEIVATDKFTPKEANGIFELKFDIPEEFQGKSLTAYEYAYDTEGKLIAKHEDPTDPEQTVHVADLGTEAIDLKDGDKNLVQAGGEIVDKLNYTNFPVGEEVTVKGKMVIHKSGEETTIVAEGKFTPEETTGVYELKFAIPEGFDGKSLTAYEYAYNAKGELIAKHEDPNDEKQTVHVADLGTIATDIEDGDHFLPAEGGKIVDEIQYTNLVVGEEVTVKGKLVISKSGEETEIVAESKFTPTEANGVFKLDFTIPEGFMGKSLTAYEYVYNAAGELIAKHEDPNDPEQTVHVADLGTMAIDKADGDKLISYEGGTVTDTVEYTNLPAGKYTVEGVAMEKESGAQCEVTDYTGKSTLVIDEDKTGSGTVDVDIKIPAGNDGKTYVMFETVKDEDGKIVAVHADCDDADQTVVVDVEEEVPPTPEEPKEKPEEPKKVIIDSGDGAGFVEQNKTGLIFGGLGLAGLLGGLMAFANRRKNKVVAESSSSDTAAGE